MTTAARIERNVGAIEYNTLLAKYNVLAKAHRILVTKHRNLLSRKRSNDTAMNNRIVALTKQISSEKLAENIDNMTDLQIIKSIIEVDTGLFIDTHTRVRKYIYARMHFYMLAKKYTKKSLIDIGLEVGGKDHATVINGQTEGENMFVTDKFFRSNHKRYDSMVFNIIKNAKA